MNKNNLDKENKSRIVEDLKRKNQFLNYLNNSIFLLEDAMNREDEEDIRSYKRIVINAIDGLIGINSHGLLRDKDTRSEDAKLEALRNSVMKLELDITDRYMEFLDVLSKNSKK